MPYSYVVPVVVVPVRACSLWSVLRAVPYEVYEGCDLFASPIRKQDEKQQNATIHSRSLESYSLESIPVYGSVQACLLVPNLPQNSQNYVNF